MRERERETVARLLREVIAELINEASGDETLHVRSRRERDDTTGKDKDGGARSSYRRG